MGTLIDEKDWLRRMNDNHCHKSKHSGDVRIQPAHETIKEDKKENVLSFKDIGGMNDLKTLLNESYVNVLNNLECAKAFNLHPPSLLLVGPPGVGKTMIGRALAGEVGVNFLEAVPDDFASSYVHGTEQKINEFFKKAESLSPVIVFIDEIDALISKRVANDNNRQNGEVNEFLCKLNNCNEKGVFLVGATNHVENCDKAALRTGRFDEIVYVDLPDEEARMEILQIALSKLPVSTDIDYGRLATLTKGYNCSDLTYIVEIAARKIFNMSIQYKNVPYKVICQEQLEDAILHRAPSVSPQLLREYEYIRSQFCPNDKAAKIQHIGFH